MSTNRDKSQKNKDKKDYKPEINAERIKGEMGCIASFDLADVCDEYGTYKHIVEIPENARRAITSFKVRLGRPGAYDDGPVRDEVIDVKFINKTKALASLGKMLGVFNQSFGLSKNELYMTDEERETKRLAEIECAKQVLEEEGYKLNCD